MSAAMPVPHVRVVALRTPTLPPATETNTYVVGSGDAVLIEPATPHADEQARLLEWIGELANSGIKIRAIWLTHHHVDHVGAVDTVRDALQVPVLAHPATQARLAGTVALDGVIDDGADFVLDGPTPIRLRAMHTPGHAPGHLCFHEASSGALVAGDMVAGVGSVLVEPTDGDMAQYLESLEIMRRLTPTMLLPAHGPPLSDADAVLVRYIQHRRMRENAILETIEGWRTMDGSRDRRAGVPGRTGSRLVSCRSVGGGPFAQT